MTNSTLSQKHLELIQAVFRNEINGIQLSIKRFRVAHSDSFEDLDYLENNNYILRKDDQYCSKLESLSMIEELEPAAKKSIIDAQQLFQLLQEEYRADPEPRVFLSYLESKTSFPRVEINRLITYILTLPISIGCSNSLDSEDASITPGESILKYRSVYELIETIKGWRKPAQKTNDLNFIVNLHKPISDFSFLLHPTIAQNPLTLYQSGHLREAVLNSVIAVFDLIRKKTGLIDEDGDRLIGKVFSLDAPHLILSEIESESGKSDQKGFIQIFKGAYQGIRNPKAHTLEHDLTDLKAAQYLVFASLMMRRIDEAILVSHDK